MSRFELRRGDERFRTTAPGVDSRHSFSFGPHYDPDNLSFGPLLVSNEDRLDAGAGFDRHAHRGVDIVTWMLAGTLEHEDSTGHRHRLSAGSAQRLRAGSGVQHAEHATGQQDPAVRYVQMWLRSADPNAAPAYASRDFTARLSDPAAPRLVTIATGAETDGAALTLDHPGAEFLVARLAADADVVIPAAALVHVFLARGRVHIGSRPAQVLGDEPLVGHQLPADDELLTGDAARITGAGHLTVTADEGAEILVWRLPA